MPNVRGLVVEVPVVPNQQLKKGDILFRIDDTKYQDAYAEKLAKKEAAESNRDRAKASFQRYDEGFRKGGAFTEAELDNRRQLYLTSEADLKAAIASLDQAKFDLDETVVRAPDDGYVTQMALRPGMMAVPLPLRPVMVFVNKSEKLFVGAFNQRSLLRLKEGYEAEVIFDALPGRVFKGKITNVAPNIAEGQFQASGLLVSSDSLLRRGRAFAIIELEQDWDALGLPDGANAEVAVYSDVFTHVAVMRRVLLRMKSWQNYVFLEH